MLSASASSRSPGIPRPPHIRVACAVIRDGGRYLVAQRPAGSHLGGLWEFPGGKLHDGETPEACIVREIREELGIEIRALERLPVSRHVYPGKSVELIPLTCEITGGCPSALEHKQIRWVEATELHGLDWCEADIPIVEGLEAAGE